jgi:hypothetical protein
MPMMRYIGISVASKKTKKSRPSVAAKTPTRSPERIRNAPMYWATRSSITSQAAATTRMVMNAVRTTNQTRARRHRAGTRR